MGPSAPPVSLFAYGTLVFPEIWNRVTGDTGPRASVRATLEGFALCKVRESTFPGIVAEPGAPPVPGLIYFDLDEEVLARLDAYEDGFYARITVMADRENRAGPIACQAYAVPPALRERFLTDEPWSAEDFAAKHLRAFSRGLRAERP